jgi:hypothetical protein
MRMLEVVLLMTVAAVAHAAESDVIQFLKETIKLTDAEISKIQSGTPVAKVLPSQPSVIAVFGAVYVNSTPDKYVALVRNVSLLSKLDNYLGVQTFSTPPSAKDLNGFTLPADDIESLKECRPGACDVQLPRGTIENFRNNINWTAPDAAAKANAAVRGLALTLATEYQKKGNDALGAYHDREHPFEVAREFESLIQKAPLFQKHLTRVREFLLKYPQTAPPESWFYWENIKFGLKPTLRINHAAILKPSAADPSSVIVIVKQLYASHYFQLALDLTACAVAKRDGKSPGFYLITVKGSKQDGLTGMKGRMLRSVASRKTRSAQEEGLASLKRVLEAK